MIWIFSLDKASACACDNYSDLFQYLLKNDNQFMGSDVVYDMSSSQLKQWCLTYCKDHNYLVIENFIKSKDVSPSAFPISSALPEASVSKKFLEIIPN